MCNVDATAAAAASWRKIDAFQSTCRCAVLKPALLLSETAMQTKQHTAPSFITKVETLKLQQAAHGTSTRIERVWRALSDAVKARFIVDGQLRSLYV
jgi:hypothetical protein